MNVREPVGGREGPQRNGRAGMSFLSYWVPVFFWMGSIFLLSSMPGGRMPQVPIPGIDKVGHLLEYGVLGFLLTRALLFSWPRGRGWKLSLATATVALLFGISDEWHQTFVPGRSGEWGEALFDTVFALAGAFLYRKSCKRSDAVP
ncbi:MAG: VanZ family protein [Candidatus Omnitrophica bacterium]|nr:VanZ family protein [Candidatus Omnitrophota bacterium]